MHSIKNLLLADIQELDATDIKTGLTSISKYIKDLDDYPGHAVNMVIIGGALSVLILHTRKSTKDIDYFIIEPTHTHIGLVGDAARLANKKETKRFPRAWINADVVAVVNRGDLGVYQDSIAQNEVVFRSDSLVVYAADWCFQLVNKMSRAHEIFCETGKHDDKDLPDAVAIMHRLLQQRSGRTIQKSELTTWYMAGRAMEDDAIDLINEAYQARYNIVPVDKSQ